MGNMAISGDASDIQIVSDSTGYIGIKAYGKFYDRFDLLALAVPCTSKKTAWAVMRLASVMFHAQNDSTFNELYEAVTSYLAYRGSVEGLEYGLYPRFEKSVQKLFGKGAKIIKRKSDLHNRPDSWVQIGELQIPVEMKSGQFDKRALNQLTRYMNAYKCKRGIAVGSNLSTKLPDSIRFISTSEFIDSDGESA